LLNEQPPREEPRLRGSAEHIEAAASSERSHKVPGSDILKRRPAVTTCVDYPGLVRVRAVAAAEGEADRGVGELSQALASGILKLRVVGVGIDEMENGLVAGFDGDLVAPAMGCDALTCSQEQANFEPV